MIDEFIKCIQSDNPNLTSGIFNLHDTVRGAHDFALCSNVQLLKLVPGKKGQKKMFKVLKWEREDGALIDVKAGSDIKVSDLVRSIRRHFASKDASIDKKTFHLGWRSCNGSPIQTPMFDVIEGITYHDGNSIKLGATWYTVKPEEGNYFFENLRFIKVL